MVVPSRGALGRVPTAASALLFIFALASPQKVLGLKAWGVAQPVAPFPGESITGHDSLASWTREDLEAEVVRLEDLLHAAPGDKEAKHKLEGSNKHHTLDGTTGAVSFMLLGAIAFQMALFYLVNWPDEDIQYYTYHIIGLAISIFTAVLVFDAIYGIVEFHFGIEEGSAVMIVAAAVQMFIWFLIMQYVTAHLAGALPWSTELPAPHEVPEGKERDAVEECWHRRKRGIKCWAGMLTHITGFAAIATWSLIQQSSFFRQSFWSTIVVVPIAFISIFALYHGADWVRYWIAMADDGKISESEELWDEESEEAENDVLALALSFLTVQAFQFWFLGALPDEKGTLEAGALQRGAWGKDCLFLVVAAVVCGFATYRIFHVVSRLCRDNKKNEDLKTRLALIAVNYTSMCFAWCLYFAVKAGLHYFLPRLETEALTSKIVIALAVSLVTFSIIFILDIVADQHTAGSEEQRAIAKVILAKGLLIGFSWEGCFATAFHCISHGFGDWVKCTNLGLSVCLCIVVIPAYRRYIMPEMERRLAVLHAQNKTELVEEVEVKKDWRAKLQRRMTTGKL
mmetsp:Transcript_85600/g.227420  ORF Transcript_85600/g.227420 Transcript_85600/m.227420 type:complete len:569 (-) Transcript_85600:127-1833(-)